MASELVVGDRVRLAVLPPYLKTADPMPMLRPADTLQVGDEGIILDRRPGGYWGVRFDRGAFLLDAQYLEKNTQPLSEDANPIKELPQESPVDAGSAADLSQ
jgi:hypothetical protein